MPRIVLATLNARYTHASLGLRYLRANLGKWREASAIREFSLQAKPVDVVEALLADDPQIVGFGVYIWNVEETAAVVALLKTLRPGIVVVLGGPEVSHETEAQRIVQWADHVITGWGEVSFAKLVTQLLEGPRPLNKIIAGEQPPLDDLALPYREYGDVDLRERTVYVEASRGCPFKCEFCLSALDKTAWPFDLDVFLREMDDLYARGLRRFKFVDRTFNLKPQTGRRILDFFLGKLHAAPGDPLFVHFEVVPDHLPPLLQEAIAQFPPGALQFEIGVQTFDAQTQQRISRRTDLAKAETNIRWLRAHTHAHLHVDLIAGLPGESLASFARGFDTLWSWAPHEIQLGILKRLRGTPIVRHTEAFGMRYNPEPPYNVLQTDAIAFADMQRFARFARYWDLVANSGRFASTLPQLMAVRPSPFAAFMALSDWLYGRVGVTHKIALDKLFALLADWLREARAPAQAEAALAALRQDYAESGLRGTPSWAAPAPQAGTVVDTMSVTMRAAGAEQNAANPLSAVPARQRRHTALTVHDA